MHPALGAGTRCPAAYSGDPLRVMRCRGKRRCQPPRVGPARARPPPRRRGSADPAGLIRTRPATSSSANMPSAMPPNAAISSTGPSPNDDGADTPAGTSTTAMSQSSTTSQVDCAADPAVHVAPFPDRHRRPCSRYRATSGHRVDQVDAGIPVEYNEFSRCAISMAVTRSTRSGQACAGSRWAMT